MLRWRRPRPPPREAWQGKPRVRVASLGGGLDSFAMLLAQVDAGEPPALAIFADVADPEHVDPGEWPGTYQHLREVVAPFCVRIPANSGSHSARTRAPVPDHPGAIGAERRSAVSGLVRPPVRGARIRSERSDGPSGSGKLCRSDGALG
jgi:hypothetical protein